MTNRKIMVYDSDVARGERLAVLMKPLAAEVVAASSLARASRQALEDRDAAVFLAVVGPLDGPAVRLFSGLKKVRPHLAIIAGAKLSKPETAAKILAAGVVDGIAAPEDEAGLYTAVRSELQKQDLTQRGDQLARSLRRAPRRIASAESWRRWRSMAAGPSGSSSTRGQTVPSSPRRPRWRWTWCRLQASRSTCMA